MQNVWQECVTTEQASYMCSMCEQESKHAKEKMKRKEMTTISFVINVFKFTAAPTMENVIYS